MSQIGARSWSSCVQPGAVVISCGLDSEVIRPRRRPHRRSVIKIYYDGARRP